MKKERLFLCKRCGHHYRDAQTAKECEAFCAKYQACSLEITLKSVESEIARKKSDEGQS
jgi:hypothetical protein